MVIVQARVVKITSGTIARDQEQTKSSLHTPNAFWDLGTRVVHARGEKGKGAGDGWLPKAPRTSITNTEKGARLSLIGHRPYTSERSGC